MNIQNIDIAKVTSADLYKYSIIELVYIFFTAFPILKYYSLNNPDHQSLLYSNFLDFINETKHIINKQAFIEEANSLNNLIFPENEVFQKQQDAIPLFSYFIRPITNIKPYKNINLLQLYEIIRSPKYFEKPTKALRNIPDLNKRKNFKTNNFDYVTFSGTFEKRNSLSVTNQSGYLCIDLDHLETDINTLKNNLLSDSYLDIQLMFVSPSGDGLKLVIFYDFYKNSLIEIFELLECYFLKVYHIQIDKSCKNIDRACFICHDKEVYINPKIKKND